MKASVLIDGSASGHALVLEERMSFWSGIDPATGEIVDPHHPQRGHSIRGRVLVLPGTRGSSAGPGVLADAFRLGNGPAGIVLGERNLTIVTAVLVADELYRRGVPVLVLSSRRRGAIHTGDYVDIAAGGGLRIRR